ncbi:MAG: TerC/Alx family metal homeostasis membrane protein [Niabella sp.]
MTNEQITYLVFGIVIILALLFDLGLLSKKGQVVTIKKAMLQTAFWVILSFCFFAFVWWEDGKTAAFEYISAYLMEWSLSIDNIFVFILIFSSFGVKEKHYGRVLLIGILMAIVFRVIFITVGVTLVNKFEWILYIFGTFLLYTGVKMFLPGRDEEEKDPHDYMIYRWIKKVIPLVSHDGDGKFIVREGGKKKHTILFVVVLMLAAIDIVFALDSIPAVMGISRHPMIIYTSNIFAVLGLRSLFFLLRGAVDKFDYLQQGIAIVLVFIGLKMLGEHWISGWFNKSQQVAISLGVIVACITGSILYSIFKKKKGLPEEVKDGSIHL